MRSSLAIVVLMLTVYGGIDMRKPVFRCLAYDYEQDRCVAFEEIKR